MQGSWGSAAAVCAARGLHCHLWVISCHTTATAAVDLNRPGWSRPTKNSQFTCTLYTTNCTAVIISLKVSAKSIPALLMRHRELQGRVIMERRSELTMAITTGLVLGWSRCAAVCRSAPRPGLSVVQQQQQQHQQHQQQRRRWRLQQLSSLPSLSLFPVPSLISRTAGRTAGVYGSRSPLMTQHTSLG